MILSVKSADVSGMAARAESARDAALGVLAENVLSDCTEYVPYDSGALQGSGKASVRRGEALVKWGTDSETARYARVQYYGVGLNHKTKQNGKFAKKARHHWFEAAKAEREAAWREMYAVTFARGLHG